MRVGANDRPTLGERFEEAVAYANRLHARQLRKGTTIPYVSHLLSVAGLVLEHGGDEDEAIAALLHDAVEDQGGRPTLEEIRRRFGARVADIVEGCTDADVTPKPPWRERKEVYIAHIRTASPSMRLVSAADKLHNARAVLADYRTLGDELWSRFNAGQDETLWYYRSLIAAYRLAGGPPLVDELERVIAELERAIAAASAQPRSDAYTEIEAKWRLAGPEEGDRLRARLLELGARPKGSRQEVNRLFDRGDGELGRGDQVLRIRVLNEGPGAILTWKGPADRAGGIKQRREVELAVDDAAAMADVLAGLGFGASITYPKTREAWALGAVEVALDELPFGRFCEIEGPEADLRATAGRLGLDPAQAEPLGYPRLMARHLKESERSPS